MQTFSDSKNRDKGYLFSIAVKSLWTNNPRYKTITRSEHFKVSSDGLWTKYL